MPDFTPGTEFAGYLIEAEIKRGGMGVVYRATDLRLQRPVALKVIAPALSREADFRARFEREWSLAASIDHPNVIPVYHAGEEDGVLYTTMLWVDGLDLGDLIAREETLSLAGTAGIVAQVAAALDAAHARGLIHRDVKPANILLRSLGDGTYHAYLSDFGLTKQVDGRTALTMSGMFVGTVDYVAPEQLLGAEIDARSDIYSLGCVLFHALAGHVPYRGQSDWVTLKAHEAGEIPSLAAHRPDLPPEIDVVIARALAKSPADRYPSAGDLSRALAAVAEGGAVSLPEASVAKGEAAAQAPPPGETKVSIPLPEPGGETKLSLPLPEPAETKLAEPEATKLAAGGETRVAPAPPGKPADAGRRTGLWVAAGAIGVALLLAILTVAGVFGGDEPSSSGGAGSSSSSAPEPSSSNQVARRVVLGRTASTPDPSCPADPCQSVGSVTGFQVSSGNESHPFLVPADGTIRAWTLDLARPEGSQRSFFNGLYGSPPEARLAILRRVPGTRPPRFELRAQGPIEVLSRYLGEKARFAVALPVQKGDIVALTVPTWAPAFARGLSFDNSWLGSRPSDKCSAAKGRPGVVPQQTKGSETTYGCLYETARLLYTATLVED